MPKEIKVTLDTTVDRSYRIGIKAGALEDVARFVRKRWKESRIFIVTDTTVEEFWGRKLHRFLFEAGLDTLLLSFPAGESHKKARTVFSLQTQLLAHGIRRESLIIALGGGVVGDVAGYVAATVLRGVAFVQVPTTLLAQVDSSVGGKVGIDHPLGKNLIGAFYQPVAVFIDPIVLGTLPPKEFRNGLAEVVKIAAALDKSFFDFLERNADRIAKTDLKLLTAIISRAVALKASVVQADEKEGGIRKALNLGHTLGHAFEAASGYALKHGEAVSIGLVAESQLAMQMGLLKEVDFRRLTALLQRLHLPTKIPSAKGKARFLSMLRADKKSVGLANKYVLLTGIGSSVIGVDVPERLVDELIFRSSSR